MFLVTIKTCPVSACKSNLFWNFTQSCLEIGGGGEGRLKVFHVLT